MLAISQKLLDGASAVGATGVTPRGFRDVGVVETVHTVEWSPAVGAGAVVIEAADREDADDDTWARVATVTYGTDRTEAVRVSGAYRAFRHRIASIVVDGTVTTRIRGSLS
jgi:hypothetical protein